MSTKEIESKARRLKILKNKQLVLLQDAIAPVQARFVAKGE